MTYIDGRCCSPNCRIPHLRNELFASDGASLIPHLRTKDVNISICRSSILFGQAFLTRDKNKATALTPAPFHPARRRSTASVRLRSQHNLLNVQRSRPTSLVVVFLFVLARRSTHEAKRPMCCFASRRGMSKSLFGMRVRVSFDNPSEACLFERDNPSAEKGTPFGRWGAPPICRIRPMGSRVVLADG